MKIILASGSPRRKEILENMNLKFDIIKSSIEETIIENENPKDLVKRLSYEKAFDVAKKNKGSIVIGSDTIVVLENQILGKPNDKKEAFEMLKNMSGKEHSVITGISMIYLDENKEIKDFCVSKVKFKELSDKDINAYIETGEYKDKAGAYGIQGIGSILVEYIKGDYFNIVGFPISYASEIFKNEFGINLFEINKNRFI
ncbi:Maf family protein [Peptacetobacter sp.]|uniref:Maf family protein n=1 Tax=Peptacetobacter sp. TaxID=2991975 RepID=UPI002626CF17|nr:nucleoside triphosphate pyrophosphatase [Peptacetobacter sp.]